MVWFTAAARSFYLLYQELGIFCGLEFNVDDVDDFTNKGESRHAGDDICECVLKDQREQLARWARQWP